MATPRNKLVDSSTALHYHIISRCVRRTWLCGRDNTTGKNYDHRRDWIIERLYTLARCFAVDIDGYAIMSNHFHLVLYYDPNACDDWSDEEVARRWVDAYPPTVKGQVVEELKPIRREALLDNQVKLAACRKKLGCLSTFMKHLKQPIAYRANREDNCTGHFFEGRFYSGVLLSDASVLAAMAYVDLNPVRARIAESIEQCAHTSIDARLQALANSAERIDEYLAPLISGTGRADSLPRISLSAYIEHLNVLIQHDTAPLTTPRDDKNATWIARVASIGQRQRAYGTKEALIEWTQRHGFKRPGTCLP